MTAFNPTSLRRCADLRAEGIEPTRARAPVFEGGRPERIYVSVRRGVCMPASEWALLGWAERHLALVYATDLVGGAGAPPVFAAHSAAAIWGLPVLQDWPSQVHTLVPEGVHRRSSPALVRHESARIQPREHRGLRVTSPARTIVDLARYAGLFSAVAAADLGLRRELCTRDDLRREVGSVARRARGRRVAELAVRLADPLSESPGESLSRVQMFLLRIPRPELQVEYSDADGLIGRTDFAWEGLVGEFDGKVKYRVDGLDGKAASEVLWREKNREDRLRRQVPGVARWVWRDARDQARLLALLLGAGLRQESRSTWLGPNAPHPDAA